MRLRFPLSTAILGLCLLLADSPAPAPEGFRPEGPTPSVAWSWAINNQEQAILTAPGNATC